MALLTIQEKFDNFYEKETKSHLLSIGDIVTIEQREEVRVEGFYLLEVEHLEGFGRDLRWCWFPFVKQKEYSFLILETYEEEESKWICQALNNFRYYVWGYPPFGHSSDKHLGKRANIFINGLFANDL